MWIQPATSCVCERTVDVKCSSNHRVVSVRLDHCLFCGFCTFQFDLTISCCLLWTTTRILVLFSTPDPFCLLICVRSCVAELCCLVCRQTGIMQPNPMIGLAPVALTPTAVVKPQSQPATLNNNAPVQVGIPLQVSGVSG